MRRNQSRRPPFKPPSQYITRGDSSYLFVNFCLVAEYWAEPSGDSIDAASLFHKQAETAVLLTRSIGKRIGCEEFRVRLASINIEARPTAAPRQSLTFFDPGQCCNLGRFSQRVIRGLVKCNVRRH